MAVPWEQSLLAQHVLLLYTSSEWDPPADSGLLQGKYFYCYSTVVLGGSKQGCLAPVQL